MRHVWISLGLIMSIFITNCGVSDFDMDFGDDGSGSGGWISESTQWIVSLDYVRSNVDGFTDSVRTDSLGFEIIPLPQFDGLGTIKIFGSCSTSYQDSIYYPKVIYASLDILVSPQFPLGYFKVDSWESTVDTISENIIHYGSKPIYRYIQSDTSYLLADTTSLGLHNPVTNNTEPQDSLGNFMIEMTLPASIRQDAMNMFVEPRLGSFASGRYVLEIGARFDLVFE